MKVLVVVDMQNDFISGALGTSEAVKIVPEVAKRIDEYLGSGGFVIFTRDTHFDDYLSTREGRNLPVVHCVKGTWGWGIEKSVYREGCPVVDKPSFGSLDLPCEIKKLVDADEIEIVGLCTDICVISNAMILRAAFPEIPISVNSSCTAGVSPESHKNALLSMKACQINIL